MTLPSSLPASLWLPFVDDETLLSSVVRVSRHMRENTIDHVIRDRLPLHECAEMCESNEAGWPEAEVVISMRNEHTAHFASRDKLVDYGVEEIDHFWGRGERGGAIPPPAFRRGILYKYLRRTDNDGDEDEDDEGDRVDNSNEDEDGEGDRDDNSHEDDEGDRDDDSWYNSWYNPYEDVALDEEKVRGILAQYGTFFAMEDGGTGKRLKVKHGEGDWGLSVDFESLPTLHHAVAMSPFGDAHPYSVLGYCMRLIGEGYSDDSALSTGWDDWSTAEVVRSWRYMRLVLSAEREGRLRVTNVRLAKKYALNCDYNCVHFFDPANIEICLQFNVCKDETDFPLEMYISVTLRSHEIS